MNMKQAMKLAVLLAVTPMLALAFSSPRARRTGAAQEFDAAATFKAKCALCHGQDASKKFDPAKDDEVLAETVLKGKDATPVKMPSYEAKGMTADQAKAMVAYMKSLRRQ